MLGDEEVRSIALEARLVLKDEELHGAVAYINSFLDMLDRFGELDLSNVEPFCFAEVVACPLREDVLNPFEARDAIMHESDHIDGEYFRVPRIMEE